MKKAWGLAITISASILILFSCAAKQKTGGVVKINSAVSKEKAVELAITYMKQEHIDTLFEMPPAHVSEKDEEFLIQFNDIRKNIHPGVCLIEVNKKTGEVRRMPVE